MKNILKKVPFLKNNPSLLLIILAVAILSITAVGYNLTFNTVTIIDEQEEVSVRTRKDTVEEVLEEQKISYIKEDKIKPGLDTPIEDDLEIVITRAIPITIEADEKTYELLTAVEDVKGALKEAGLELGQEDNISHSLEKKLEKGMEIIITRAIPCSIEVDGETIDLFTIKDTVEEVLEEAKISLGKKDKINLDLDEKVEEDVVIKITRVTQETITEKEEIDFKTIRENDSSMKKGSTKTVGNGQNGVKEKEVKVTYEDGKEVSREVIQEKAIKEPVDRVIKVGTKVEVKQTASRGNTSRSSAATNNGSYRTMRVVATAYSSQDPGVGTRTSTGARLARGIIAVDPSVIPYGTRIYIPGYGFGTAADTGGAIRGNKIDVAFDSRAEALQFGRKTLTIQIYD